MDTAKSGGRDGMQITTRFNLGDRAFVTYDGVPRELTIGQVRVEATDSPGYGETIFGNYQPQKGYVEQYMCVETGIGSGSLFTLGKHIFGTYKEAADYIATSG
jgi:hypothetical protein